MAQVKEQNPAQAQNNPNRNSESGGEKRTRTRRPYYNRRPRRTQQSKEAAVPIHIYPLGGLGEVGKNMTVYECNGDMIIVGSELQKLILYNRMRLCYDGYIYEKRTLCSPEGQKRCGKKRGIKWNIRSHKTRLRALAGGPRCSASVTCSGWWGRCWWSS